MKLWEDEDPSQYAILGSRSGSSGPNEQVLLLDEGRIDLRPVVLELEPGHYRLRLMPVREKDREGIGASEQELQITKKAQTLWIPVPAPGFYELDFTPVETSSHRRGVAWILVSPRESFQELARSFNEAIALTAAWSRQVDGKVIRGFLRSYLAHLSRTAG